MYLMFGKVLLKKIEFDFVTMQHAAYFLKFLKTKSQNFKNQGISWNTKAIFWNTCNEKALGTKWFHAFPIMFFSTCTSFRFHNFVFCQNVNLMQSRLCCAIVNKLSTLLDFAVHYKKCKILIFLLMNYLFKSSKIILSLH